MSGRAPGMVWFVGAGPGDPELITVKGRRLLAAADFILYADALIPRSLLAEAKPAARIADSSSLSPAEAHAMLCASAHAGETAVRLHPGDGGLYGSMREQKLLLDAQGIPTAVVHGISAAFAAAAAAGVGFTVPGTTQSLVMTRLRGLAPVPEGQRLRDYARHGGSLAVYLSAGDPELLAGELRAGGVPEETPVVVAARIGRPEERIARVTLADLVRTMEREEFSRQTIVLILPGEGAVPGSPRFSRQADFAL